jgi:hypothetical protein
MKKVTNIMEQLFNIIRKTFNSIITFLKKQNNTILAAILVIVVTTVVNLISQNLFWNYQNKLLRQQELQKTQYNIISEFAEGVTKIEMLREKIYWNKFYAQLSLHVGNDTTKNLLSNQNKTDSSSTSYFENENEYRKDYENTVAKFEANLILIPLYFNVPDEKVTSTKNSLAKGFCYDSDFVESELSNLSNKNLTSNELINTIDNKLEEKYNHDFFNNSVDLLQFLKENSIKLN